MKTKLKIIIAFLFILTSFAAKSQNIISGYNDNDVQKLQTFFAKTDGTTTNGVKINSAYSSTDPTTWSGVTWNNDAIKRVTKIDLNNLQLVGSFDCSNFNSLTILYLYVNQLTSLNVSGCSNLDDLSCNDNQITSLDVSGCSNLITLACSGNKLTSLDLSGVSMLDHLLCIDNQLTSLDLSACNSLTYLSCSNNQLTSLDLSACNSLTYLSCSNNQLTSLDLSGISISMSLSCENNQLKFSDMKYSSSAYRLSLSPQSPFIPLGVTTTNGTMAAAFGGTIDLSAEANVSPNGTPAATTFHIWKKAWEGTISDVTPQCNINLGLITLPPTAQTGDSLFITMSNSTYPDFVEGTTPASALSSGMRTKFFALVDSTVLSIKVYPNPANNQVSIYGNEDEINSIRIYNSLGQDVTKYTNYSTSNTKQKQIDISKLTTGIYILKTKNTTNKLIVK